MEGVVQRKGNLENKSLVWWIGMETSLIECYKPYTEKRFAWINGGYWSTLSDAMLTKLMNATYFDSGLY